VLVRFLVRDDEEQYRRATQLILGGTIFLSDIVIAEAVWVLRSAYRYPRKSIVSVLRDLLASDHVVWEHRSRVEAALSHYDRHGADLADWLIRQAASESGADGVYSFDLACTRTGLFREL
jgi:predicted nucleic-acid-binding protein